MLSCLLMLAGLPLACSGHAQSAAPQNPPLETNVTLPEQSGPALSPSADLMVWLAEHQGMVQLPFTIKSDVMGIEGATLMATPPVEFGIDDTAMSLGLADQLPPACSEQEPCVLWLEGSFGELVPLPGMEAEGPVFAVRKIIGPVRGSPTHAKLPTP